MFFADDSLLFFQATNKECLNVKDCLTKYKQVLGQIINFNKSSIMFSASTSQEVEYNICDLLWVQVCDHHGKYLGAPSFICRDRQSVFAYIKDKAWKRMYGWNKNFSRAGKDVLLKSYKLYLVIL